MERIVLISLSLSLSVICCVFEENDRCVASHHEHDWCVAFQHENGRCVAFQHENDQCVAFYQQQPIISNTLMLAFSQRPFNTPFSNFVL